MCQEKQYINPQAIHIPTDEYIHKLSTDLQKWSGILGFNVPLDTV